MDSVERRRAVWGWVLYDWGNSAFATTIMAAVLPVYYATVAASNLTRSQATAHWGYTASVAALLAAVVSPVLGALSDFRGAKKRFLAAFMLLGATSTALLYFVRSGAWPLASVLFVLGNLGFAGSLVFYDALLPYVATPEDIDQVSSRGFAMGYAGGGILLALNVAMIALGPKLWPDAELTLMPRLAFVSAAVWWALFSLPLLRRVPEPPRRVLPGEEGVNPLRVSFRRLAATLRDMRRHRDLFVFLLAFWIYSNGIGTIIVMAAVYGAEIGIPKTTLAGTLLMVQFVGMPFALLFGRMARRIGAKDSIRLGLVVYSGIAIFGYFLNCEWHFWVLGAAVATVQGGTQALSRSVFGRMVPKSKSAEFFGFFSVFEKFSTIAGPAVFGLVTLAVGSSRLSIVSVIVFFVAGLVLLARVNVERGVAAGQREEARMAT